MYKIKVIDQSFSVAKVESSVVGSVGVERAIFEFDSSWTGLQVFAAFKNSSENREYHILLDDSLECTIPWEVYSKTGDLLIGALGLRDDRVVKPTLWGKVSTISSGVSPTGESPTEPTPSQVEQITSIALEAKAVAEKALAESGKGVVKEGYGENSIQGTAATAAGSMAFSITAFDTTAQTYTLDSVEGLEVGMRVSIQLKRNYDDCGTITEISGSNVKLSTFCYTEGEDVVQESSHLKALDYPELGTYRFGTAAAALGYETKAGAVGALSAGYNTEAHGKYSTAFGNTTKAGYAATALGRDTNAKGRMSLAFGDGSAALEDCATAGGFKSEALGYCSVAVGYIVRALGPYSTALGTGSAAEGVASTAEGGNTRAAKNYTHAGGYGSEALADVAFAHGDRAIAAGASAVALGLNTTALGAWSFAAPFSSTNPIKEGQIDETTTREKIYELWSKNSIWKSFTIASGKGSVALGRDCAALGDGSVALGYSNIVYEWGAQALGHGLISVGSTQTVVGKYNEPNPSHIFQVGAGTGPEAEYRTNAFWVNKDGSTSVDVDIARAQNTASQALAAAQDASDEAVAAVECHIIDHYDLTLEEIEELDRECIGKKKILIVSVGDLRYVCPHVHHPDDKSIAFIFVNYAKGGSITINRHAYNRNTAFHETNIYNFYSNKFAKFDVTYDNGVTESFNVMTF